MEQVLGLAPIATRKPCLGGEKFAHSFQWAFPRICIVESQPYQEAHHFPVTLQLYLLRHICAIGKFCQLLFITPSPFAFPVPGCERNTFVAEIMLLFSESLVNSDLRRGAKAIKPARKGRKKADLSNGEDGIL